MSRDAYTEEDYRELEERVVRLTRANQRLSGALSIVLDTLDSENVAMLFDRVLDRITETFGADGTLVYFAAPDGFHLRGATDSLSRSVIPEFMDFGRSIETLAAREGHALRLRVSPPDAEMLRSGTLSERTVVREDTQESFSIETALLPPFAYSGDGWCGSETAAATLTFRSPDGVVANEQEFAGWGTLDYRLPNGGTWTVTLTMADGSTLVSRIGYLKDLILLFR